MTWNRTSRILFATMAVAAAASGCQWEDEDHVAVETNTLSATPTPWTDTLAANRERLIADWANRMGYEKCQGWQQLSCAQKGAFLTLTHRLQVNRFVATGRQVLDHVTALYGIAPDSGCGGSGNRIFFSMEQPLWQAMWDATRYSNSFRFVDHNGNNAFKKSDDAGGPHSPFNLSTETVYGHPRGQGHFWWGWADGQQAVCRPGVGPFQSYGCIVDWLMMEFDQDYNWIHDSSTECSYTNNDTGFYGPGRQYYEYQHPYIPWISNGPDYNWAPAGCYRPQCGGCSTCGPQVVPVSCSTDTGSPSCHNAWGEEITCPTSTAENCSFEPPPPATSCEGRCGLDFDSTASCQCDSLCTSYGDCCADFTQLCQ